MTQLRLYFISAIIFAKIISAADSKKYCIHMDVNKTIIALDTAQNKTIPQTINEMLASSMKHKWDNVNETSYESFVIEDIINKNPHIIRGSDDMKKIKRQIIEDFPKYLFKNHYEIYEKYKKYYYNITSIISDEAIAIFPSFYKFINWLETEHKNKYSLYLRTFGNDLDDVIFDIESKSSLRFTNCGKIIETNILFTNNEEDQEKNNISSLPINCKVEMNIDVLLSLTGHYALQDDYKFWQQNNFQAEGGKLFPLNDKYINIFFDDNADGNNDNRWIIRPIKNGVLQDTKKLIDAGIIVPVYTVDAIIDDDYFINKFKNLLDQNSK